MAGQIGTQLGADPLLAVELVGWVRSAGIGHHPPLRGLLRSAGAIGPTGTVDVAAVGAACALTGQPLAAVGPADDCPGPGGGLAGVAFAVQLDDHVGAQDGVLLLAADPLVQLGLRPGPGREGARVEGHKHWVKARRRRLTAALAGGGDAPLADGVGVAGRHPEPVAGEGFAQRRPAGAQFLGGGVDTAELLGQRVRAFGLGAVCQEAAGLPAQRVVVVPVAPTPLCTPL